MRQEEYLQKKLQKDRATADSDAKHARSRACTHIHTLAHTLAHAHLHMHTKTHKHTHMHTHKYTYTHAKKERTHIPSTNFFLLLSASLLGTWRPPIRVTTS